MAERDRAAGSVWGQLQSAWHRSRVTLAVHADAFRLAPKAYLQAVAWRMRGLRVRSRTRISSLAVHSPRAYELWIARDEPKALAAARTAAARHGRTSVVPVVDCREGYSGLDQTLDSIVRAGGTASAILVGGPPTAGTILITNARELAGATGSDEAWLCVLRPGDRLAESALSIYAATAAQAPEAQIIYADDDLLDLRGRRHAPHFKPGWNPELFEHHDYITGAAIVRADHEVLAQIPTDGWVEALTCRAIENGGTPMRLPLVLHHRRQRPRPLVPGKPANLSSGVMPPVTVIVPTRNQFALLRNCIEGLKRTAYPELETIIVDNGSNDPDASAYLQALEGEGMMVLRMPGPFNFSALNNAAVAHARGEQLCFLNNDVEMIDPDWLALLVRQAIRPERGAVGARLLYPDGTVQHAGVFVGIGGAAGHGHRLQRANEPGYFERARLPQRVSGVTGACLVVARDKFLAVGGFDERDFPIAFNDVDLCLKLGARGWASFYEPRATLIHHESKSRGSDRSKPNRARFAAELAALKRKWHTDERRDPYHHPQLSPFSEQFLIAI